MTTRGSRPPPIPMQTRMQGGSMGNGGRAGLPRPVIAPPGMRVRVCVCGCGFVWVFVSGGKWVGVGLGGVHARFSVVLGGVGGVENVPVLFHRVCG